MSAALLLHQHTGWESSVCWSSSVKCSLRTSTLLNLRATCTWPTLPPERWRRPQFSALMIASYVENRVTDFMWENIMSLRDVKWILFAAQSHRAVFLPLTDRHIRITVSSLHTENHRSFQWTQLSSIGRKDNNYQHQGKKNLIRHQQKLIFLNLLSNIRRHKRGFWGLFDRASSSWNNVKCQL